MKKYQSIQYMRAIAALMVVFHHTRNPAPGLYDPLAGFGLGQAGVDIFFVISGFIMYSAAKTEAPIEFMKRRLVRIWPMYFLATAVVLALQTHLFKQSFSINHFFESLLFIPHYSPLYPSQIWPILVPGWTLNFEMFFYLIFALGLTVNRLVAVLTLGLATLVVAGIFLKTDNALWVTYTSPLLLEFLAGIFIAKWSDRALSWRWALLLPIGIAALGIGTAFNGPRFVFWGAPAALMVIGAIALERSQKLPTWKVLGMLGDASYSIYLFQGVAIFAVTIIIERLPLKGVPQLLSMIGLGILAATLLGLLVHLLLEKPISRWLLRRQGLAGGKWKTAA